MNPKPETSPSLLPKILLGVVFLSLLLAFFLGFDLWRIGGRTVDLAAQNAQISQQINQLETSNQVGALYGAQKILERAEANRIVWSQVAANLLKLEKTTDDMSFKQFKVAPDGSVTLSGETQNIKSVAILLQALRASEQYDGPFVPTINGESGVYNFQLQFNYLGL